eukprot:7643921-Pyramimonas_sp.AAC.1
MLGPRSLSFPIIPLLPKRRRERGTHPAPRMDFWPRPCRDRSIPRRAAGALSASAGAVTSLSGGVAVGDHNRV